MRESLQTLCECFAENREVIRKAFRMESGYLYPVCANIFCARGVVVRADQLESSKALIKEKTGVFSNFRGTARLPVACMLALRENPSAMMEETLACYDALKQRFWGSEYLALVAFLLAEMARPGETDGKVERGRAIYDRMKKEHPFLTSSEDSVFAVLMAFSEKTDEELVADMEACYALLKPRFSGGNTLQSVSHVLALADGAPQQKADRLTSLYDAIIEVGGKYGRRHELATLAALSLLTDDVKRVAADMMDVDAFLARQGGYHGLLGLDRRTRMMHAAMIASDEYMPQGGVEAASLTDTIAMAAAQQSTIALIAAQQAAMCAVIAASAASSASHSH